MTMRFRFTNEDIGTTAFYEADLMGEVYDPPGVTVHRDEDGVPWFEVRQELADEFEADGRFEPYDQEDNT